MTANYFDLRSLYLQSLDCLKLINLELIIKSNMTLIFEKENCITAQQCVDKHHAF